MVKNKASAVTLVTAQEEELAPHVADKVGNLSMSPKITYHFRRHLRTNLKNTTAQLAMVEEQYNVRHVETAAMELVSKCVPHVSVWGTKS
ncbi:hypothetical protein [uncultured Treponema sp.]|nr:hypothetical protein [uncultured Treponema sp.]